MYVRVKAEEQLARRINDSFLTLDRDLNELLRLSKAQNSENEFKELRRSVGDILGILYQEVILNIYEDHPNLKPEGMP